MKRRFKNQHFREAPSFPLRTSDDSGHPLPSKFHTFYKNVVRRRLKLTGYKLKDKSELAVWMIRGLIMARQRSGVVADSRDNSESGVTLRLSVWNAIVAAKLADSALGSERSGCVTRYRATNRLMRLHERWELDELVDVALRRNTEEELPTEHSLICLHSERLPIKRKPGGLRRKPNKTKAMPIAFRHLCIAIGLEWVRNTEDAIEAFNRNNLCHTWQFTVVDPHADGAPMSSPLNPCVRQIHYGGQFFLRGMRFHSWSELSGQSLSKVERKTILIDGEAATELDFSCSQIRTMYHWRNIDPPYKDVYRPKKIFPRSYRKLDNGECRILREFVKSATLRCLNVKSRGRAHSSVTNCIKSSETSSLLWAAMTEDGLSVQQLVRRIVKCTAH